jgi:uncharacterized protein (DUF1499 family)
VKIAALVVVLLLLAAVLVLAGLGLSSRRKGPGVAGAGAGRLAPCPGSPNCVASSEAAGGAAGTDAAGAQAMAPLRYDGAQADAQRRLLDVLHDMPGATVVAEDGPYLHAEFRSRGFGFVDDVEFLFDDAAKRIDFRSASRVGHSDFGANRARMTEIARRFAAGG